MTSRRQIQRGLGLEISRGAAAERSNSHEMKSRRSPTKKKAKEPQPKAVDESDAVQAVNPSHVVVAEVEDVDMYHEPVRRKRYRFFAPH